MNKMKLTLSAALLAAALPLLQGCFPLVAGGVAVGVMSAHDRRLTGVQADDETSEWKAAAGIPEQYKEKSHVNFTAFNQRVLITGEVPNEEAKTLIGQQTLKIDRVLTIYNELTVGPASSLSSRSTDAYITSKIKARFVDSNQLSANHVKVVTENGTAHLLGILNAQEAKVAVNIARTTDGVRKVINVMEIVPETETRRIDSTLTGGAQKTPAKSAPAPVETR
jgi:osmotically-inducible protein OsmY